MTPANMEFGRELRLPCDLLFGAPPDMEQSTTGYAADLVERLHDIHHNARRYLKVASDRMKACYNRLASSAGFHEDDQVWLYRPTRSRGKSRHGKAHTRSSSRLTTLSPNSAAPPGKNDGGTPQQTGAIAGGYS
jgi:hypothetical protein